MREREFDAAVIGGGAAGLATARIISAAGFKVAIVEREGHLGGILCQCVHNGFGLKYFKKELTGPEYAEQYAELALNDNVEVFLNSTALDFRPDVGRGRLIICSGTDGVTSLSVRALVLAMGCRERNRGNLGIPGARPAGVFTAGSAQRLLNIEGCLPGKKAVIIGSGDIGLIMARRLTWVGAEVSAVVEILPYPSGITRNVVQCLNDFNIPLYLSHAVTKIGGANRVESVEIAPLEDGVPNADKAFTLECDTVLLSVGLLPENEFSKKIGVQISPDTNGPRVNANMMTNVDGVFACGNVLHVHDLVDFVTEESERCGQGVVEYLRGQGGTSVGPAVRAGSNIRYVTPRSLKLGTDNHLYARSLVVRDKAELRVTRGDEIVLRRPLRHVKPAEMINLTIQATTIERYSDIEQPLEISLT